MTAFGPAAPARAGFEALGFDPAPGQLANIETLGQRFATVSQALGDAHQDLTRIGQADGVWQGAAAEAFRNTVGELPGYLDKAHQSLEETSRALQLWHTDLASMQQRAAALEAEAREALRALEQAQANPDLGLAGQYFPDPGSLQAAQHRLAAAHAAVREAQTELEAVREQARRLLAQHVALIGAAGDILGFFPTPVTLGLDTVFNIVGIGLQGLALGGHLLAREAGADVHNFTIAADIYGLFSGAIGAKPGPLGSFFDAVGLAGQGGVELGSGGDIPTFWGDLGDYWVPKNPVQAGLYAIPGIGLAVPFWNAIEQGHRKDVEAREGGG